MPESPRPAPLTHLAAPVPASPGARVALGVERLDGLLGGGLQRGRLHELWPASPDDRPAAAGFALLTAALAAGPSGTIVYIAEDAGERRGGALHGPGLRDLGLDPARLLLVRVPDAKALLRVAADVVRSPAVTAAVVAPAGAASLLDLTASRRLTLFAERSGVLALLLRVADPAQPSAAATRWQVAAAPSRPLEAEAPGHPAFLIDLVRQRGGPPADGLRLEWRRDRARFAPLSGDPPAVAGGGYVAAGR